MGAILLLVALTAFIGVSYVVGIKKGELATQLETAAAAKAHERELASLVRVVNDTKQEREELDSYVLSDEGVIDFLTLIESVAKEQGVELKTSNLTEQDGGATFERVGALVTVAGTYESIAQTLAIFESLPYQSGITSIVLTKDADSENGWAAQIELAVTKFKGS